MNVLLKSTKPARWHLFTLPILTVSALCSFPVHAQITSEDYLCQGDQLRRSMMNIDGEVAHLYFYRKSSTNQSYLRDESGSYNVYFDEFTTEKVDPIPRNQQDWVFGQPGGNGPGYGGVDWDYQHRIVFRVDFKRTPSDYLDDQRFDGYILTQTQADGVLQINKDGFAGITWKTQDIPIAPHYPVGFWATFHHCD